MTISWTAPPAPMAVDTMAERLTVPFARGADRLALDLLAGATPDVLTVAAYDFAEHRARFGTDPEVSHVLSVRTPVAGLDELRLDWSSPTTTTTVTLPAPLDPGDAFVITPPGATSATRLTGLRGVRAGAPAPISPGELQVTALLGTMARLLWVLGVERDRLAAVRDRVRRQRVVSLADGSALDLIGADLQVPRFPPTPYAVDDATIALYHCDDRTGPLTDAAAAFPGRTPHPGTPGGDVTLRAPGRYDAAVRFGTSGTITVPDHSDFDIGADTSFSVECFVKPDPATTVGPVIARTAAAGTGWSLEIGDVGLGIPQSVKGTIGDGSTSRTVVSPAALPTDRFTHLALVLARDPAHPDTDSWSLAVDGVTVATTPATGLGAVGSGDVVLGPGGGGFAGTVDEVRLSSTARTVFHPVLGEADEQYRRRLGLFRRWVLPTPAGLQDVLNTVVPALQGTAEPFVVTDTDGPVQGGTHLLRVWPVEIAPQQSTTAAGVLGPVGADPWPDEEPADPALLGRHTNPAIDYATLATDPTRSPTLAAPDPQLMQPGVAAALDRLAELLPTQGILTRLGVRAGYDQAATDSRAAGRAVLLAVAGAAAGRLAALAHRAGFDYVEVRPQQLVYAACAPGRTALLGPVGTGPTVSSGVLPEVTVGTAVTLTAGLSTPTYTAPTLSTGASARYWTVPACVGRGEVTMAAPTDPTATLQPTAPGVLGLSADLAYGHHVTTVTGSVRVLPTPLADGAAIAADGTLGVTVDVVGPAEATFDPAYLMTHDDARIDYGADPDHHRMQRGTGARLTELADLLAADASPGLQVQAAYDAAATDLAARGRLLVLTHTTLGADVVAVQAHRAGFGYVARAGSTVRAACPAGEPAGVDGPDEVEVGQVVTLTAAPDPSSVSATTRLGWSAGQALTGAGVPGVGLAPVSDTAVAATGTTPGVTWVRATLRDVSTVGPYAVTVRRRPELATATISRTDYYLIMNALNTLHPIGVEVRTDDIRAAVVELAADPSGLDPAFTYPPFRLHRPAPVRNSAQFPSQQGA